MSDPSSSLSFDAAQLLGALERRVVGQGPPGRWLRALLEEDRALIEGEAAADGRELDPLVTAAEGDTGEQGVLTRSEIVDRAHLRAGAAGRLVTGRGDVAAVVLAALGPAPPTEVPLLEPEPTTEPEPQPRPGLVSRPRPTTATVGRPRTFRVFVSSTFKDLEAERNVLHERAYPALATFCAERGARFQPIDLRWGVSEEASLDQAAMSICLGEIERCHEITPRPNFLILLGNRYGWLALPPRIPATEFQAIREQVVAEADRVLLEAWYQRDDNADPAEYRLRPRAGEWAPPHHQPIPSFGDVEARRIEEERRWEHAEADLRRILTAAVTDLAHGLADRRIYEASATEQEIRAGALGGDAPEGRAFCFIREIELTDEDPDPRTEEPDTPVRRFLDPEEVGPEKDSSPLARLKQDLDAAGLPIKRYSARWVGTTPSTDHLDELAADVQATLEAAIEAELEHPVPPEDGVERRVRIAADDHLDAEGEAHRSFAEERIQNFVDRTGPLAAIDAYLSAADPVPLLVHGAGGTGKSALLGEAVRRAQDRVGTQLVHRFIGATPGSADGRSLLEGLCRELARRYGADEAKVPSDLQELTADFRERLEAATAGRPLVLVIDSLDQLAVGDGARRLTWIPQPLPAHVRLVVSTRPGDTFEPLRVRLDLHETGSDRLLEVGRMSREDGDELLGRWLHDARRDLQVDQRTAVLDAFDRSGGNPLYLRLAFEEARRWISEQPPEPLHLGEADEEAENQDQRHPQAVEAIIEHNTFGRLADEENHGEVLVAHALGYLAAARHGLAEDELLELLSRDPDVYAHFVLASYHVPLDLRKQLDGFLSDGEPDEWVRQLRRGERDTSELYAFLEARGVGLRLPVVLWSRFSADLRPYLTERVAEGAVVIDFYHRELDTVASRTYLDRVRQDGETLGSTLHGRLADFFHDRADRRGDGSWTIDGEEVDRRGLSELPYHLTRAQRWDDVYETLTDFTFLEQKTAKVAVTTAVGGEETTVYRGVFALQEDFDTALRAMPGGEDTSGRPRLIVTVVDLGAGLALRCPHCNTSHPIHGRCPICIVEHDLVAWQGNAIDCPNETCKGPLKVNDLVVPRT